MHINPDGLYKSPAFSQAVLAEGGKTLYIGGQNGVLSDGKMAGDTLAAQTEQALKNIIAILKSVGASQENVVKQTIYLVKGQDIKKVLVPRKKSGEIFQRQLPLSSLTVLAFRERLSRLKLLL